MEWRRTSFVPYAKFPAPAARLCCITCKLYHTRSSKSLFRNFGKAFILVDTFFHCWSNDIRYLGSRLFFPRFIDFISSKQADCLHPPCMGQNGIQILIIKQIPGISSIPCTSVTHHSHYLSFCFCFVVAALPGQVAEKPLPGMDCLVTPSCELSCELHIDSRLKSPPTISDPIFPFLIHNVHVLCRLSWLWRHTWKSFGGPIPFSLFFQFRCPAWLIHWVSCELAAYHKLSLVFPLLCTYFCRSLHCL